MTRPFPRPIRTLMRDDVRGPYQIRPMLVERGTDRSNHLLRLVVGLAVAPQDRGLCPGIKLGKPRRDFGILPLEQAVSGEIALYQKRSEILHVEHPHGLREAKLFVPVDAADALDAAAEQRSGAIS